MKEKTSPSHRYTGGKRKCVVRLLSRSDEKEKPLHKRDQVARMKLDDWRARVASDGGVQFLLFSRRVGEKIHKGLTIRFGPDGLFRHFGARRVVRRPDFEQLRNCLLGPNNVEFLQGR